VKYLLDGVSYLLESFRKHIIKRIVGEKLGTSHDQGMRSHRHTNNDPSNLADLSGSFKRRSHWLRHETGCYTGAEGHDRALGTCRRCDISQRMLNQAA